MTTETKSHAAWLETFERLEKELGRDGREWLAERRRTAIERFAELGFPTTRDETWRFTPVTAIARTPFAALTCIK